jgi:glycosyltransferase involved in cell wall biosynthesis
MADVDSGETPEAQPATLRGRDIVCVGFADWDTELWTNQHHLMSRLAQQNKVLFVESLGLRRPQLARRDVARIARRLRRGLAPPRKADGLAVLSPLVLPLHSNRAVRALNRRLLNGLVRRATRRLGMERPILWAYVPQAESLIEALGPQLVVYHCVDDMAAQAGIDGASFRAAEARFAARADLVLASAPALSERMRKLSNNVLEAPNVADTALFATALEEGPVDAALAALPTPRVVFTGAIVTTKLDLPLLVELARARPSWSFALVGPVGPGDPHADVSALQAQPNIHLLGPRSYRELPAVLRGADAGLIPYARNELTGSIFPMKVYEYLAAGLPVVSTPLPALANVAEVATTPDAERMVELLEEALAADTPAGRRALRRSRCALLGSTPGRDRRGRGGVSASRDQAVAHGLELFLSLLVVVVTPDVQPVVLAGPGPDDLAGGYQPQHELGEVEALAGLDVREGAGREAVDAHAGGEVDGGLLVIAGEARGIAVVREAQHTKGHLDMAHLGGDGCGGVARTVALQQRAIVDVGEDIAVHHQHILPGQIVD